MRLKGYKKNPSAAQGTTRGKDPLDPRCPLRQSIIAEKKLQQEGVLISKIAKPSQPDERHIDHSCLQEAIGK